MLFGSTSLEVIIGLCYIYFLLSLICSMVNELIATLLGLRAETLRQGINQLLTTSRIFKQANDKEVSLQEAFWSHPLIDKLGQPKSDKWRFLPLRLFWFHKKGTPSYVDARTFATVLLDLLPLEDNSDKPQTVIESLTVVRDAVARLSTGDQNKELSRVLRSLLQTSGFDAKKLEQAAQWVIELDHARQALQKVGEVNHNGNDSAPSVEAQLSLIDSLEKQVTQVETELAVMLKTIQHNIETYYNELMDRAEGWYKRYVQMIILGVAIVATVLLNADTLAMANQLAHNQSVRQAILLKAESDLANAAAAQPAAQPNTDGNATGGTGQAPAEPAPSEEPGTQGNGEAVAQTAASDKPSLDEAIERLASLDLLGWKDFPIQPVDWVQKIAGLAITIAAASLGAPFWFELLGHLVNMRLAGKRPEETPRPAAPVGTPASPVDVVALPIHLATVPTTNGVPDRIKIMGNG